MKKTTLILVSLLCSGVLTAQNLESQKVVSLKAGFSLTGFIISNIGDVTLNESDSFSIGSINTENSPAITGTFDYALTDMFSIGAMFSYQSFVGSATDYNAVVGGDSVSIPNVDFKLRRIYFGATPKIHWIQDNDRIDVYAGIRFGVVLWNNDINSGDKEFKALDQITIQRPVVGLVPIGVNVYFNEDFGANLETALGAPYVFSLGINYRF